MQVLGRDKKSRGRCEDVLEHVCSKYRSKPRLCWGKRRRMGSELVVVCGWVFMCVVACPARAASTSVAAVQGEVAHPRYDREVRQLQEHYSLLVQRLAHTQARLEQFGLHLGSNPQYVEAEEDSLRPLECVLCTETNPMSCRQLIEAMPGHKVVAPCKCDGTSKWIQLSEFNRMRRKEPLKWKTCSLCKAPFRTDQLNVHTGIAGSALSYVLDEPLVLTAVVAFLSVLLTLITLPFTSAAAIKILTSEAVWNKYPLWRWYVHLPFPIPLVIMQWALAKLVAYVRSLVERGTDALIDWETNMIESQLPITVREPVDAKAE